jgi:hypothetical protein
MKKVGFVDGELVGETGFDSSPVTKGALFRARKGTTSKATIIHEPVAAERDHTTAVPGEDACRSLGASPG